MNDTINTTAENTAKLSNKEILDQIAKLTAEKHSRREALMATWKKAEAEYVQWRETEYRKQREALLKMLGDNHEDRLAKREERKAEELKRAEEKKAKLEAKLAKLNAQTEPKKDDVKPVAKNAEVKKEAAKKAPAKKTSKK